MCSACRTHWQWSQRNWILAHVEKTLRLLAKRSPEIKILLLFCLKLELIFNLLINSVCFIVCEIIEIAFSWNHFQFTCLNLSDIGTPEFSIYCPTIQSHAGCLLAVWFTEVEYIPIKNTASPKLADEHTHCCSALPSPELFFDNSGF